VIRGKLIGQTCLKSVGVRDACDNRFGPTLVRNTARWDPDDNESGRGILEGNNPMAMNGSYYDPVIVRRSSVGKERDPDHIHQVYRDIARMRCGRPVRACL